MCIRDRVERVDGHVHLLHAVEAAVPAVTLASVVAVDEVGGCLLYTSPEPTRLLSISYAVFCLKKKIINKTKS